MSLLLFFVRKTIHNNNTKRQYKIHGKDKSSMYLYGLPYYSLGTCSAKISQGEEKTIFLVKV